MDSELYSEIHEERMYESDPSLLDCEFIDMPREEARMIHVVDD